MGRFFGIRGSRTRLPHHGLTLSKQQRAHARERYRREGIDDKASASFTDYRDCAGTFDKIVSIEMFEAVGQENWDNYFQTVRERLTPGGIAILQVITIDNGRFDQYRKSADFIQRHIFPGGLLPSPKAMSSAIARNGLELRRSFYFGKDYAKTCRLWRNRFQRAWPEVAALGFDERFKRMWEYYLSYCEAGFNNGAIDVGLFKINAGLKGCYALRPSSWPFRRYRSTCCCRPFTRRPRALASPPSERSCFGLRILDVLSDPMLGWVSDCVPSPGDGETSHGAWRAVRRPGLDHAVFTARGRHGVLPRLLGGVLFLAWTAVQIPYLAWAVELEPDYQGRSRLNGLREAVGLIGILAASGGMILLTDLDTASRLRFLAWTTMVSGAVAFAVALRFVPEFPNHGKPARLAFP